MLRIDLKHIFWGVEKCFVQRFLMFFWILEDSLQAFREAYGDVSILTIVVSEVHRSKHDPRPFAFASIVWRDRSHEFHVFRERWVFDGKRWYTRVVGLVTHQSPSAN